MAFMANTTLSSRLRLIPIVVLAAALAPLAACDDQNNDGLVGPADRGRRPGGRPGLPPKEAELPALSTLGPGWTKLEPAGHTSCAGGAPFAFFVRPGAENRVVIDFGGGGSCWDEESCSRAGVAYQDKVNDELFKAGSAAHGIYDHEKAENPFKGWTHVYVPLCTGDMHWGDRDTTYREDPPMRVLRVRHRGAVNTRAALAWVYENITAPEKALVTGCSAGAYGSILWAAHVKKRYAETKVYQLGDSGVGVATDAFVRESFESWGAGEAYPTWIPGLSSKGPASVEALYTAIGAYYPSMPLAQYSTKLDKEQIHRFDAMGGDADQWPAKMKASLEAIEAKTRSFRSFAAPGDEHCVLPRDDFYSLSVCGTKLSDWVSDRVNDRPVNSVDADTCPSP